MRFCANLRSKRIFYLATIASSLNGAFWTTGTTNYQKTLPSFYQRRLLMMSCRSYHLRWKLTRRQNSWFWFFALLVASINVNAEPNLIQKLENQLLEQD